MKLPILIVDDDPTTLESLQGALNRHFHVIAIGPPEPVTKSLEEWNTNEDLWLALVDVNMTDSFLELPPEQAGFELVTKMKAKKPEGRVALRSGYQNHAHLAQGIDHGADGFIGKDWPRDQLLHNLNFFRTWVTAGATLRSLAVTIEKRIPRFKGHNQRTRDLCRAIIFYCEDITSQNFDLAACLLAAELHDLGHLSLPDSLYQEPSIFQVSRDDSAVEHHVELSNHLRWLGPGFDKVQRMIQLHHRAYDEPRHESVTDYPKDESLPRREDIPIETRVIRVADVFDNLIHGLAPRSINEALAVIQQQTEYGAFDPRVVAALRKLASEDRKRLETIYPNETDQEELEVYFLGPFLTAGQVRAFLDVLTTMFLRNGRVSDLLTMIGVEACTYRERAASKLRFVGRTRDVQQTRDKLDQLRSAHAANGGVVAGIAHLVNAPCWRPIPDAIETLSTPRSE